MTLICFLRARAGRLAALAGVVALGCATLGALAGHARAQPAAGQASAGRADLTAYAAQAPAALAGEAPHNGLARTPYLGWNTYYALSGNYNESTILSVASSMTQLGLLKAGYRYIWLDYGWASGKRDASGNLIVNPAQWPHGLSWLTSTLHSEGFEVGIYTDAGTTGCHGKGVGSYGYYQQDANQFAAWGFDAVKMDFCGASEHTLDPYQAYLAFSQALARNSSHRPMLFNLCNFRLPGSLGPNDPSLQWSAFGNWTYAPVLSNSWRTDTDLGTPGRVGFYNVLRNLDADAMHPQVAGPGHWNDPDYLVAQQGMSDTQFQTQMTMWAMVAAPLVIGDDPRTMTAATVSTLTNPQVLAVDQDPLGRQGTVLATAGKSGQIWVKPLTNHQVAVALLNRGSAPLEMGTTGAAAGLPKARAYRVLNAWTGQRSITGGPIAADVPGDGAELFVVTPPRPIKHSSRRTKRSKPGR